jgi:hypothetical protein
MGRCLLNKVSSRKKLVATLPQLMSRPFKDFLNN